MKKIIVISTSLRPHSNSDLMAHAFARGAADAGHVVETISLIDKELAFCRGCLACQKLGRCVTDDAANPIAAKVKEADVVAFATPVYYYGMCGQMKTLLDRMNSLYAADYRFRDVYLLTSAADDAPTAMERVINSLEGWIECFEHSRLAGVVKGFGNEAPGDVEQHAEQLSEAYEMGKNV